MNETLKNIDKDRTPAEQLAEKAQFQTPTSGQVLIKRQLIYNVEDRLRDAIQAQRKAKNDPRAKAAVLEATHDVDTLMAKKVISRQERDKILTNAQSGRLASIVEHLDPSISLDVFDEASPEERRELSRVMHQKYVETKDSAAQAPNDELLTRFRTAAAQLANGNRPEVGISPEMNSIVEGIVKKALAHAGLSERD